MQNRSGPGGEASTPEELANERRILRVLMMGSFFNIVDFVIMMPLAPFLVEGLGVRSDQVGFLVSAYTLSASVSGLVASRFLDRFDRRSALVLLMAGLTGGTLMCALAGGFWQLLFARILAGTMGGPATSLSFSIVGDVIPVARRGAAYGAVNSAFSIASVLGVPAGIALAQLGGWHTPFIAISVLGVGLTAFTWRSLPSIRGHISGPPPSAGAQLPPVSYGAQLPPAPAPEVPQMAPRRAGPLWTRREALYSWGMIAGLFGSSFGIIPYLSPYLVYNLGYPMKYLGLLYMIGGSITFFSSRLVGRLTDRFSAPRVFIASSLLFLLTVAALYGIQPRGWGIPVVFCAFMVFASSRGVPALSLASRVTEAHERGEFMSIQSALQHCAAGVASLIAPMLIVTVPGSNRLEGAWRLGLMALIGVSISMVLVVLLERALRSRGVSALR